MLGKRYSASSNSEIEPRGWVCTAICKNACEYAARALCHSTKSYNSILSEYKSMHFFSSGENG